jgi:mono/diheme cytochrome c family protein
MAHVERNRGEPRAPGPAFGVQRKGRIFFYLGVLCVLGGSVIVACSTAPTATPTPTVGTVTEQLARGAPLYAQNCATAQCHGTHGEGLRAGNSFRAFPLVGPLLAARNPTAQVIFDVVRSGDEQNLRAMTDQQIYDAIAYELSQNGVELNAPLTAQSATTTSTGTLNFDPDAVYPPLGDVTFLTPPVPPRASWFATNDYVALRVDQIAQTNAIGHAAPSGSVFALVVFALQDLTNHPLEVDPNFMRLYDTKGASHEPQPVELASPIERLHPLTIQSEHGTAAIAVFTLPADAKYDRLVYDDQTGHALSLKLSP